MEITWHGNTCFSLKEKSVTVVINPDDQAGKLKGDIVLSSLKEGLEKVEGSTKVFDWPGEYELNDIPIVALQAWTKSKAKEEDDGKGDKTLIFCFEIGGIKCCHLGNLGHTLISEMVKQIGDVDILMINVGKTGNLSTNKAMEIIESIEPRALIAMGEGDFTAAFKDLGAGALEPQDAFTIKAVSELPDEKRLYISLKKV